MFGEDISEEIYISSDFSQTRIHLSKYLWLQVYLLTKNICLHMFLCLHVYLMKKYLWTIRVFVPTVGSLFGKRETVIQATCTPEMMS